MRTLSTNTYLFNLQHTSSSLLSHSLCVPSLSTEALSNILPKSCHLSDLLMPLHPWRHRGPGFPASEFWELRLVLLLLLSWLGFCFCSCFARMAVLSAEQRPSGWLLSWLHLPSQVMCPRGSQCCPQLQAPCPQESLCIPGLLLLSPSWLRAIWHLSVFRPG